MRRCTAVLHDHLKISKGADHSTKALAHVLLALGELQVPFDTVYPLVLAVCDILHDRTPSMDATCAPLSFSFVFFFLRMNYAPHTVSLVCVGVLCPIAFCTSDTLYHRHPIQAIKIDMPAAICSDLI